MGLDPDGDCAPARGTKDNIDKMVSFTLHLARALAQLLRAERQRN